MNAKTIQAFVLILFWICLALFQYNKTPQSLPQTFQIEQLKDHIADLSKEQYHREKVLDKELRQLETDAQQLLSMPQETPTRHQTERLDEEITRFKQYKSDEAQMMERKKQERMTELRQTQKELLRARIEASEREKIHMIITALIGTVIAYLLSLPLSLFVITIQKQIAVVEEK